MLFETFVQVSWWSRSHLKVKQYGNKLSLSGPQLLHSCMNLKIIWHSSLGGVAVPFETVV